MMAIAFVCDICGSSFKVKHNEVNTISFDCRDINGNFLLGKNPKAFYAEDRKDYHICKTCKQEITKYINNMIYKNKDIINYNKEESE